MSTATVSRNTAQGLPPELRSAQAAVQLPEVQEMLRRLSGHGLGIFMPHMHDERTGDFLSLPGDLTQVEAGLECRSSLRRKSPTRPTGFCRSRGFGAPVRPHRWRRAKWLTKTSPAIRSVTPNTR